MSQAALLHNDIPGYDLPTINFASDTEEKDEGIHILEEQNQQIYVHLDNVLIHMIDKEQPAIFKSVSDFNCNKDKMSEYINYAEHWQVASTLCSYMGMICDILIIVTMIIFFLKYHKTVQAMLAAFISTNIKNLVQADYTAEHTPIIHD